MIANCSSSSDGMKAVVSALMTLAIFAGCARSEAAPSKKSDVAAAASEAPAAKSDEIANATSKFEGKNFKLELASQGECKAGAECSVVIKLETLGEYHINKEYPYKFKAEAKGDEVEFLGTDQAGKNIFSKTAGDFRSETEQKATLTVKFKPARAGTFKLAGVYKLSVCSAQNCQLESQALALDVAVK